MIREEEMSDLKLAPNLRVFMAQMMKDLEANNKEAQNRLELK